MRARTDELAELMTREGGKPLVENRDEVGWTASAFDFYAELARTSEGRVIPPVESSQLALVLKEPLGARRLHRAVELPAAAARLEARAGAGGRQRGALQAVRAHAAVDARARAVRRPPAGRARRAAGGRRRRRRAASSTTSASTGSRSPAASPPARGSPSAPPRRVARVNLELGGKDPFIVCADVAAEIEIAARGGAWAAFLNAGQVCTSAERFYVQREVYDDFLNAFVDHTRTLRIGDPMDPATDVGPMVSAAQRDKVRAQVEAAVAAGARAARRRRRRRATSAATTTRPPWSPARPRRPTCCARRRSARSRRSCRSRTSTRRSSSPTARRTASAPTSTRATCETAIRCARELRAGTVWINDPLTDNDAGPFGGMKRSGLGRELGQEGLDAFQETKHVHIETKLEVKDWWYPYGMITSGPSATL